MRDAADHALQHLMVDRRPRTEPANLLAGHRTQFLQFVVLGAFLRRVVRRREARRQLLADRVAFCVRGRALAHQALLVERRHRGMLLDLAVHQRLRVARVVAFVVAVAAIADHIDHHVLLELLAVVESDLHHPYGGIGIVAVDVENRRLHAARDVRRVRCGARFVRAAS